MKILLENNEINKLDLLVEDTSLKYRQAVKNLLINVGYMKTEMS